MSKSIETSLMKTLSINIHLAKNSITFNTVATGDIYIPNTEWRGEKRYLTTFKKILKKQFRLGKMVTLKKVADVIIFICSKKTSILSGVAIQLDSDESSVFKF